MKKILICLALMSVLALPASAFEIPDNSYYFIANTQQLGDITVYVPRNMASYFSYSGNTLIGTNSSTITCYGVTSNGTQYNVRFPSYDIPEYRLVNYSTGTSYQDLTISSVTETNLPILTEFDFQFNTDGALVGGAVLFILVFLLKKR